MKVNAILKPWISMKAKLQAKLIDPNADFNQKVLIEHDLELISWFIEDLQKLNGEGCRGLIMSQNCCDSAMRQ